MDDDPEVVALVCALAKYLQANPLACDAPDGIGRWWLPAQPVSMEKLMKALDWMQNDGLVESTVAADGRLRYRCIASAERLQAVDCRNRMTRH
jgi:hypothetical protein